MSNATKRTIRLVKAQGIREAADLLAENGYPTMTPYTNGYNDALGDAYDILIRRATELEEES